MLYFIEHHKIIMRNTCEDHSMYVLNYFRLSTQRTVNCVSNFREPFVKSICYSMVTILL